MAFTLFLNLLRPPGPQACSHMVSEASKGPRMTCGRPPRQPCSNPPRQPCECAPSLLCGRPHAASDDLNPEQILALFDGFSEPLGKHVFAGRPAFDKASTQLLESGHEDTIAPHAPNATHDEEEALYGGVMSPAAHAIPGAGITFLAPAEDEAMKAMEDEATQAMATHAREITAEAVLMVHMQEPLAPVYAQVIEESLATELYDDPTSLASSFPPSSMHSLLQNEPYQQNHPMLSSAHVLHEDKACHALYGCIQSLNGAFQSKGLALDEDVRSKSPTLNHDAATKLADGFGGRAMSTSLSKSACSWSNYASDDGSSHKPKGRGGNQVLLQEVKKEDESTITLLVPVQNMEINAQVSKMKVAMKMTMINYGMERTKARVKMKMMLMILNITITFDPG